MREACRSYSRDDAIGANVGDGVAAEYVESVSAVRQPVVFSQGWL